MLVVVFPNMMQLPRELTVAERFCPPLAPNTYERSPIPRSDDEMVVDVLPRAKRTRTVWPKTSLPATAKVNIIIARTANVDFFIFLSSSSKIYVYGVEIYCGCREYVKGPARQRPNLRGLNYVWAIVPEGY